MRVALVILSVSAVTFLLHVLLALVKEWMHLPPRTAKLYFAKYNPKQRGELVILNPAAQGRDFSVGVGEQMAL